MQCSAYLNVGLVALVYCIPWIGGVGGEVIVSLKLVVFVVVVV